MQYRETVKPYQMKAMQQELHTRMNENQPLSAPAALLSSQRA
jgi:hypothetical protein